MQINTNPGMKQLTQGQSQVKPKETSQDQKDQVELGSQKADVPQGVHKKWLFMNYIAADCNLKEFQYKNIDNQELVGSDANTHIVAMIDGGPEANPVDKAWSGARTYYVNHDTTPDKINSPVLEQFGDHVNMSDPKTLTKFIVDTMQKFPADNIGLVLNDHGGGWTGALADDSDGKLMSVPQIRQALEDAEKITGKKIDILGFDACLMADTQAAYEFKDNVKILLASEESEGGAGWTYSPMLGGKNEGLKMLQDAMTKKIDVSPEEFAKLVVKVNEQHQQDISTFSATDLTKMEDLAKATDKLGQAILKTDEKKEVKQAIMQAENYGQGWAPYGDMRDLHNVVDLIEKGTKDPALKEAAEGVKKVLSDAIMANESGSSHPESKGLHIYAPVKNPDLEADYKELKFTKAAPNWTSAVETLQKVETPDAGGGNHGGGGDDFTMTSLQQHPPIPVWPDGSPKPV
jgi:hypothetical protein